MKLSDRSLGVFLVILGAALIWYVWDFPTLPRQAYGAGTFPTIIAAALMLAGVGLAWRGRQTDAPSQETETTGVPVRHLLAASSVPVAVAAYVIFAPLLGFPIVAPLIVAGMMGWLTRRWSLSVTCAIAVSGLIWLAFAELLRVPLPLGFLEELIY
jgi:putative tricarboxylic transport membrane protein